MFSSFHLFLVIQQGCFNAQYVPRLNHIRMIANGCHRGHFAFDENKLRFLAFARFNLMAWTDL